MTAVQRRNISNCEREMLQNDAHTNTRGITLGRFAIFQMRGAPVARRVVQEGTDIDQMVHVSPICQLGHVRKVPEVIAKPGHCEHGAAASRAKSRAPPS